MNVKINETGESKTLRIISENGVNWVQDLIGNAGGFSDGQFVWSEEDNAYLADEDTYDWWAQYIAGSEATDAEMEALAAELDMDESVIRERIAEAMAGINDYDDHRRVAVGAMAELREAHTDYAQLAKARVVADDDLGPESDILLEYEWDNQTEHLEWVATADKAEILSWVKAIRNAENATAE